MRDNISRRINKRIILSEDNIKKYWNKVDSDILAPLLYEMDKKETWVVNKDPSTIYALNDLSKTLSANEMSDKKFNEVLDQFITFLAYINSSWAFRILKWLEENRNLILTRLTVTCTLSINNLITEDDEIFLTPYQLFIDRMLAIKNLGLVSKVFSEKRAGLLNKIISNFEEKEFKEEQQ